MLLLDRETPEPPAVSNTSYSTATQTLTEAFVTGLQNLSLDGCGEFGCLLIVQSLQQPGWTTCGSLPVNDACTVSTYDPTQALPGSILSQYGATTAIGFVPSTSSIGYSLITTVTLQDTKTGTVVVGRGLGQGWERLGCTAASSLAGCAMSVLTATVVPGTGTGQVSGYLIWDTNKAFTFTYGPSGAVFATGTGQSATSNTMIIGGSQVASQTVPAGFHVVTLDRTTLAVTATQTFSMSELASMSQSLSGLDENDLVMIASIGQITNPQSVDYFGVGGAIGFLGGTYQVFYNLSGDDYSLVGAMSPAPATSTPVLFGTEASSYISKQIQPLLTSQPLPSNISGVLNRDNRGYYRPMLARIMAQGVASTYGTQFVDRLDPYAFTSPTTWPVPQSGNTAQANAYTWISSCVTSLALTCPATAVDMQADIRGAYFKQITFGKNSIPNSGLLTQWSGNLKGLTCPAGPDPAFDCTAFDQVQAQLEVEISDVEQLATLAANFQTLLSNVYDDQSPLITNAQALAKSALKASDASTILVDVLSAAAGLLSVASYISTQGLPLEGTINLILDALSVGTTFGLQVGSQVTNGGSPNDRLATTFGTLNTDVAGAFNDATTQINGLFDLIVSDWGRLQALGTALQTQQDANSPWYFDPTATGLYQNTAAVSLLGSYTTSFLASVFQVAHLLNQQQGHPPDAHALHDYYDDCPEIECVYEFPSHVWRSVAVLGTGQVPTSGNDGQVYDQYLIAADAHCPNEVPSASVMPDPPQSPMFAHLDPSWSFGDLTFPNLGLYDLWFFIRAPFLRLTDPKPDIAITCVF